MSLPKQDLLGNAKLGRFMRVKLRGRLGKFRRGRSTLI